MQDSWQTPRNARTLAAYMALKNREIGERIVALRKSRGNPPQEIVAQRLAVANRSYQSWEAGDTKPSWRNLSKLAKFYGVTEEFILLGDELEKSAPTRNGDGQLAEVLELLRRLDERLTVAEQDRSDAQAETLRRAAAILTQLDDIEAAIQAINARRRRTA